MAAVHHLRASPAPQAGFTSSSTHLIQPAQPRPVTLCSVHTPTSIDGATQTVTPVENQVVVKNGADERSFAGWCIVLANEDLLQPPQPSTLASGLRGAACHFSKEQQEKPKMKERFPAAHCQEAEEVAGAGVARAFGGGPEHRCQYVMARFGAHFDTPRGYSSLACKLPLSYNPPGG